MEDLRFFNLNNDIEGFWAKPGSGFGHICDEQPLPYLRSNNIDLSPRLGGEENENNYTTKVVPLPYGNLSQKWPLKQKIFNFFRKPINIYWRKFFISKCPKNKLFLFLDQLNYKITNYGFTGNCPLIFYERMFELGTFYIHVKDSITFKEDICFENLIINPVIRFKDEVDIPYKIKTSHELNTSFEFKSSSGEALWNGHKIHNCRFKKFEKINYTITYTFQ